MSEPQKDPMEVPLKDLDEALERSARELEILSTIYRQRGHSQEAAAIDDTLAGFARLQDGEDF